MNDCSWFLNFFPKKKVCFFFILFFLNFFLILFFFFNMLKVSNNHFAQTNVGIVHKFLDDPHSAGLAPRMMRVHIH